MKKAISFIWGNKFDAKDKKHKNIIDQTTDDILDISNCVKCVKTGMEVLYYGYSFHSKYKAKIKLN